MSRRRLMPQCLLQVCFERITLHLRNFDIKKLSPIFLIDELKDVACETSTDEPTHVQAFPVSSKQIVVLWSKPVGNGYKSNLLLDGGEIHKNKSIKQGVSPVSVKGFTNLEPNTTYKISIKRVCTSNPSLEFEAVTTTVTTFKEGTFHVVYQLSP